MNNMTAARERPAPQRSDEFVHLSLEGLRTYRRALTAEEGRVSYWRRLVQARQDLIRAATEGASPRVEDLRSVLAEPRLPTHRMALIVTSPVNDLPPLPDLAALWARDLSSATPGVLRQTAHDLAKAERQLSAYRAALHRRLAAATTELIARYRENPLACLSALPHQPARPRRESTG